MFCAPFDLIHKRTNLLYQYCSILLVFIEPILNQMLVQTCHMLTPLWLHTVANKILQMQATDSSCFI